MEEDFAYETSIRQYATLVKESSMKKKQKSALALTKKEQEEWNK